MIARALVAAAFSAVCATASAGTLRDTPVTKALQLLADLQAKIIQEGEHAQKVYAEFTEWCEERSKELNFEIKTGKQELGELEAMIAQSQASIEAASASLDQLTGELTKDSADLAAAQHIRTQEREAFYASEKELTEAIDTLQRAVRIIEREMKGGASMAQLQKASTVVQALSVLVDASKLSTADASQISALVQSTSEEQDVGAPAAAVYESHSGDIVQVLTDLLEKAEDQLDDARRKEVNDQHAFDMMEQSLKDEIKYGQKEIDEAKLSSSANGEKKAKAEGDHGVTSSELKSDEQALKDLHTQCMTKAEDFEAETKSRGEEIAAVAKAQEVIKESVSGASDLTYSFVQLGKSSSGITSSAALAQYEVIRIVRDLARNEKSSALAQLASRLRLAADAGASSGEDQFAKVKALIQNMIERLESEAGADATKHAYCEKELAESNEKHADKTAEIDKLTTQIDKMAARSAQLKEEVANLQRGLAELASSQGEMNKIRATEKEAFVSNKADMEEGLQGIKLALKVLREYYAKEDKAHSAAEGAGTSIISLLEVVESDFTKGVASMTAEEEGAQAAYESQTKENEIDRATKEQDVKYKDKESTELDKSVAETNSDRSGVQEELAAVNAYLKQLHASCDERADTYEERKARFEAELAGLREALRVLESETAAAALVQRAEKRRLRGIARHG